MSQHFIQVISNNIISLLVAIVSISSARFIHVFIRNPDIRSKYSHDIAYVVIGQAVLICPLSGLIRIGSSYWVGRTFTNEHLLFLAAYLIAYLLLVCIYVSMGSETFRRARRWVQSVYCLVPLVFVVVSAAVLK
jgi:hypothetical protein